VVDLEHDTVADHVAQTRRTAIEAGTEQHDLSTSVAHEGTHRVVECTRSHLHPNHDVCERACELGCVLHQWHRAGEAIESSRGRSREPKSEWVFDEACFRWQQPREAATSSHPRRRETRSIGLHVDCARVIR
jgi:hypothetical protein